MTDTPGRDDTRDIALLLQDAALTHEAEGRSALARHHRRAALRMHDGSAAV